MVSIQEIQAVLVPECLSQDMGECPRDGTYGIKLVGKGLITLYLNGRPVFSHYSQEESAHGFNVELKVGDRLVVVGEIYQSHAQPIPF